MYPLLELMREQLPEGGVLIPGGREAHMEVIEVANGRVWMSVEPATQQDYDALVQGMDESLKPVGIGAACMDAALFCHCPNCEGVPVLERIIGGHRFINVAIPGERTPIPGGMMRMMVNKAHVVGFESGRSLAVLSLPDGDFVEVVGDDHHDDQMALPPGGRIHKIVLSEPWVVPLPTPTITLWDFSAGLRSFQGPVVLPEEIGDRPQF